MIAKIVLLALLGSLANASPEPWGHTREANKCPSQSNIIDGTEVVPNSYPYAVHLDAYGECMGTLINSQYVVTIAQCVKDSHDVFMILGAHDLNLEQEEGRVEALSRDIKVHEFFHPACFTNDIALIKLPEPVAETEYIKYAHPPTEDFTGEAKVVGWGQIYEDDAWTFSSYLREGSVRVADKQKCFEYYGRRYPNTMCVMVEDGYSFSFGNGEFGAGIYENDEVKGLGSFMSGAGCRAGGQVYTNIFLHKEWIEANIEGEWV